VIRALPWLVVAVLVGVLVLARNGVTHDREREAIRVADTVYIRAVDTLTQVRRVTDSVIVTDTLIRREVVTQIVERERLACDAVISACEQRAIARDALIRSLRPPRLLLYGEAGVSVPPSFLGARMDGEAGVALRVDRNTHLQAGATTTGDLRLSVRRTLKLF
jgi:hypothetical protein